MNNPELSEKILNEMHREFLMGRNLTHENIINYRYFTKIKKQSSGYEEYHIVMEYMEGGSLA